MAHRLWDSEQVPWIEIWDRLILGKELWKKNSPRHHEMHKQTNKNLHTNKWDRCLPVWVWVSCHDILMSWQDTQSSKSKVFEGVRWFDWCFSLDKWLSKKWKWQGRHRDTMKTVTERPCQPQTTNNMRHTNINLIDNGNQLNSKQANDDDDQFNWLIGAWVWEKNKQQQI